MDTSRLCISRPLIYSKHFNSYETTITWVLSFLLQKSRSRRVASAVKSEDTFIAIFLAKTFLTLVQGLTNFLHLIKVAGMQSIAKSKL